MLDHLKCLGAGLAIIAFVVLIVALAMNFVFFQMLFGIIGLLIFAWLLGNVARFR